MFVRCHGRLLNARHFAEDEACGRHLNHYALVAYEKSFSTLTYLRSIHLGMILCEGSPTWMCGPVAEPGIAWWKAVNGMPLACRYAINACPSALSGLNGTSIALWWS